MMQPSIATRRQLIDQLIQSIKRSDVQKAYTLADSYSALLDEVALAAIEKNKVSEFLFGGIDLYFKDELFVDAIRHSKSDFARFELPDPSDLKKKPEPSIKPHPENKKQDQINFGRLRVIVGRILEVKRHHGADSLFIETGILLYESVDIGEEHPRTICSGLVNKIPIEEIDQKLAIFCCNLKPVKMRGVLSQGMILVASDDQNYQLLVPPKGSRVGDRIICSQFDSEPDVVLNPKHKIWETVQNDLKINEDGFAEYQGHPLIIKDIGNVTVPSLTNCKIS